MMVVLEGAVSSYLLERIPQNTKCRAGICIHKTQLISSTHKIHRNEGTSKIPTKKVGTTMAYVIARV